jgi:hypothetical protein
MARAVLLCVDCLAFTRASTIMRFTQTMPHLVLLAAAAVMCHSALAMPMPAA